MADPRNLIPLLFIVTAALIAPAADATPVDPAVRTFFSDHCVKCHGPEKQKGDFRIDSLAAHGLDPKQSEAWEKIAEAIEFGDMPPKKEPRPDEAASTRVVEWIGGALATTGERPLALRRMNRHEYEYTVHDLLGIDAPLKDLLPEDSSVQGFDNVADGLSISSVLMERYLEAADVAFEDVIRRIKPLEPSTRRAELMQVKENIKSVEEKRAGVLNVHDSIVKFTGGWPPVRMDEATPQEPGVYQCRVAVWPYQPEWRTLVVAIYVGPLFGTGEKRLIGYYDVTGTPEDPRVIEFTSWMDDGWAIEVVPWIHSRVDGWKKDVLHPGVAFKWMETHGPLDQEWPNASAKRLFGEDVKFAEGYPRWMRHRKGVKEHYVDSEHPKEDAERVLREFIPRAFRRPVAPEQIQPYVTLVHGLLDQGRTYEQAMRAGVAAVLCSPQFLVLNSDPSVDDYTLASRLSYFLWSTMPDDELMRLAADGKLRDKAVLHAQVERMLKDPRRERFVESFTGQWLDLREIEFTTPDKKLYWEFDELLQESMLAETHGFFRHLLDNNLSVANFIDSDFAVLNQRLAHHYGLNELNLKGHEHMQIVKLPDDSIRGGVLAHASVLKVTANGTTTSPVLRGVWVLDHMLGRPAPPPPPGVPAVEPDIRGATSIRDQLDKHRADTSCARCHFRIDPPGFALEQFDPVGAVRKTYPRVGKSKEPLVPVTADGELPDGRSFTDFAGFRDLLMEDRDDVARAIAMKLLIYGTGRPIGPADRASVEAVVDYASQHDQGLRSMIHGVVDSELFTRP